MLKNFFKSTFRNLWHNKVFSLINIAGLSAGMSACFLIFLYVHFELSYDSFNSRADRIYRVVGDLTSSAETLHWYNTPGPMAKAMKKDFPEVQEAVRIVPGSVLVRKDNIKFQETHSLWADGSIFTIFNFPLIHGDPKTALQQPNCIVFSETAAQKYFGHSNPVGRSLYLSGKSIPVVVTGVMKDIPENSHIQADILISMATYSSSFVPWIETDWTVFNPSTYLLLRPGTSPDALRSKLPAFFTKYAEDDLKKNHSHYTASIESLKDVYLHSSYGAMVRGSLSNLYIYSIIGIFVLTIACVNFINLATARSIERAKEVGIRKCAGASKEQLVLRFLSESVLTALLAWVISVFLCFLALPLFNQLAGKTISPGYFSNISYSFYLLLTALSVGLIAGIYPAFVLSSFLPVLVLKGRFASGKKGSLLRKTLVVAQFVISICLIVGTLIVRSQVSYMRDRPLGFNKNNVLVVSNEGDPAAISFKKLLAGIPAIQAVSTSSAVPGRDYDNGNDISPVEIQNSKNELQRINVDVYNVDADFLNVFKIKLLAGRNFFGNASNDTAAGIILNKTAADQLGYSSYQDAMGRHLGSGNNALPIIGVIDDFHFHSLKEPVQPLCLLSGREYWQYTSIKIAGANLPATINTIRSRWQEAIPYRPFNYFFLDEDFDSQYRSEENFGRLFLYFSILALFISILGLLGLASYSTSQRTKEIGIRKTLGASVPGIVNLLFKDFVKLVILSFIISCPVSWFFMNKWLQSFAYRTTIGWAAFAIAGVIALTIALLTISFQAIKAALANPVKSLRSE